MSCRQKAGTLQFGFRVLCEPGSPFCSLIAHWPLAVLFSSCWLATTKHAPLKGTVKLRQTACLAPPAVAPGFLRHEKTAPGRGFVHSSSRFGAIFVLFSGCCRHSGSLVMYSTNRFYLVWLIYCVGIRAVEAAFASRLPRR